MDAPKREVSWLESFPPDIWAYFVCYLPGEQLGRLMMTGARLLWRRLKSPKVVRSIKLGQDFIVFKSVPGFLNDFPSLEELSIHICYYQRYHEIGLTFDSIPSGCRKVELSGYWSKIASTMFGGPIGTLDLAKHLPHMETLHLRDLEIAETSWMSHTPQSLTKLSLYRWDGTVELPSSLIDFEADDVDLNTRSFVTKLPSALNSFVVSYLFGVDLLVPLLPPSTQKVSFGHSPHYSDGSEFPQKLLEQLPKTLAWFLVPHSVEFATNPEFTSLLPATLTELEISNDFPCSAWSLLPRHLKRLAFRAPEHLCTVGTKIIDGNGIHRQVRSYPFELLPRSITSLHLKYEHSDNQYFCGPPATCNQSYFPPQLTCLKISHLQLSSETAKLLPSSLTHLKIGNFSECICEHLPAGIKTLKSAQVMMSPNLFNLLPKSLTCLRLPAYPTCARWFDDVTGEFISPISKLSDYSVHKTCFDSNLLQSASLPPNLIYLNLANAMELGDSFLSLKSLPNLLEFRLPDSTHFTDNFIPRLSPHITTLNLDHATKITGKSFAHLPRCLTYLNLNFSESIFDSDIQCLPRTLKHVHLWRAIHLTDKCISDLPPHLELINLRYNAQITPSSFPHFPYPLRSSQLDHSANFARWDVQQGVVRHK